MERRFYRQAILSRRALQPPVRPIHAAIERGVTLFDTGDFYAMGHNEMLLGRAIEGRRDKVQISVKFGALRGPDNSWGGMDSRPAATKNFSSSLRTRCCSCCARSRSRMPEAIRRMSRR